MSPAQRSATVHDLIPLLYVDDVDRSVAFYRDHLGFDIVESWEPDGRLTWCRVERDGASVMLQTACPDEDGSAEERGRGVAFFFLCDDADAMYEEVTASGLQVDPPTVAFYGMKQLFVKDPDGYGLCFQNPTESYGSTAT